MEFYGVGNMVMLANTGSYFIIQVQLIMIFFSCKLINFIAVRNASNEKMRRIGMYVYNRSLYKNFKNLSEKLFIENFFDMSVAISLHLDALSRNNYEFKQFFKGLGNWVNSVLFMIYALMLSLTGVYYHVMISRN